MKPSVLLLKHRAQIKEIALRHHVASVSVFGSALHGNDLDDSDLDLLVEPTVETTMFDIGGIQFEVSELLGIPANYTQAALLPVAWLTGGDLKAAKRLPVEEVTFWGRWGQWRE